MSVTCRWYRITTFLPSPLFLSLAHSHTLSLTHPCSTPSGQAVTATADGDLILWDSALVHSSANRPTDRRVVKVLNLYAPSDIDPRAAHAPARESVPFPPSPPTSP